MVKMNRLKPGEDTDYTEKFASFSSRESIQTTSKLHQIQRIFSIIVIWTIIKHLIIFFFFYFKYIKQDAWVSITKKSWAWSSK